VGSPNCRADKRTGVSIERGKEKKEEKEGESDWVFARYLRYLASGKEVRIQVVVRVSSWKPGSESLERMMSLGDPKIRLHSTIWRSRGS